MIELIKVTSKEDTNPYLGGRNYGGGEIKTQEGFDYLVESKKEPLPNVTKIFSILADYSHNFSDKGLCIYCFQERDHIFFTRQIECYKDRHDRLQKEGKWDDYVKSMNDDDVCPNCFEHGCDGIKNCPRCGEDMGCSDDACRWCDDGDDY